MNPSVSRSEQLFQLITENVTDLIAVIDEKGHRIWHNAAYRTRLGYTEEDLAGKYSMTELHPDDKEMVKEVFIESMRTGIGRRIEYRMRRKDGSWLWLESQGRIVNDIGGQGKCLVLVARDISARKERETQEKALMERRQKQNDALMELSCDSRLRRGDLETALREIIDKGRSVLGCERIELWKKKDAGFSRHLVVGSNLDGMPEFETQAVEEKQRLADRLCSVQNDAFIEFKPPDKFKQKLIQDRVITDGPKFPIGSGDTLAQPLIAPLLSEGEMTGMLLFFDGEARNWSEDEKLFAASLVDLILLTEETHRRQEAYRALLASQKRLAAELAEASAYVKSLLPAPLDGKIFTEWQFIASTELGGDAFGYNWLDPDHFALYLLDVCGHGVGAALLSSSAITALRNQVLPQTDFHDPSQVIARLNETFTMERHNNMFFTIWYGVYDCASRRLTFASAGHPPAMFFSPDNPDSPRKLGGSGLMVGAMPEISFPSDSVSIPPGSSLLLYSDGAYEIKKTDDTVYDIEEFVAALRTAGAGQCPTVQQITQIARNWNLNREPFEDDFSLVRLVFS